MMINGFTFVLLLIFGGMFWIYSLAKMSVKKRDGHYSDADTETIQEMHRGLERMAQRIDSLETILLDQGEHYRRTPPPTPRHETTTY